MKKVSILGVLVGGIADIVATNILLMPFMMCVFISFDLSHVSKDQLPAAWTSIIHSNLGLYVGSLLIGLGGSVIGGYVAAWIAKHDEMLNGVLSSWLCVALGIYGLATAKVSTSLGEHLVLLLAGLAAALFGGYLRLLQNRSGQPRSAETPVGP